jgi:hypothetical protein
VLKAPACLLTIIVQITFAGYMKAWLTYSLLLCLLLVKGQHFITAISHDSSINKTTVNNLQSKNQPGLNATLEPDDLLLYSIEDEDNDDESAKSKTAASEYLSTHLFVLPFYKDLKIPSRFSNKPCLFPHKYIFHRVLRV